MSARIVAIAFIASSAIFAGLASSRGQGFSGLGADPGNFAPVVRGRALTFPADHGAHPEHRIEWWYVTANLKDAQGVSYGVQWTLFRQAAMPGAKGEGWSTQQLWMGHAALTSAATHRFAEKFARGGVGQAGVEAQPFSAFIDDWQMKSIAPNSSAIAPLELTASGKDFSYRLRLDSDRPVVLQGDAGYSIKSERGQASYYYSQPYLRVTGALVVDGRTIEVTGQGWIDREWSSQPLAADQSGWDWLSLHFNSGDKLMLYRMRQTDGKHYGSGKWITRDGPAELLGTEDIAMTPLTITEVEGRKIPTSWRIAIAKMALSIECTPLNARSWMGTSFPYWEGPIRFAGSHAGMGYLEMTGY